MNYPKCHVGFHRTSLVLLGHLIKCILGFVGLYWNGLNPIEKDSGGGKRDRTADLLHAMQALSQLSYTPI